MKLTSILRQYDDTGIIMKYNEGDGDDVFEIYDCELNRLKYDTYNDTYHYVGEASTLTDTPKRLLLERQQHKFKNMRFCAKILLTERDYIKYSETYIKSKEKFAYIIINLNFDRILYVVPKTLRVAWFETEIITIAMRLNCFYLWRELGHRDCMGYIMAIFDDIICEDIELYKKNINIRLNFLL